MKNQFLFLRQPTTNWFCLLVLVGFFVVVCFWGFGLFWVGFLFVVVFVWVLVFLLLVFFLGGGWVGVGGGVDVFVVGFFVCYWWFI